MGARGPVPKRDDQRRRTNTPEGGPAEKGEHVECTPPPAKASWHPIARAWYDSLPQSGQSWWYQASDWATAYLLTEEIDRQLKPQVIGLTKDGDVIKGHRPMGAALAAILKGMTNLMVTEGDRRRARVELERQARAAKTGSVSWIDQARRSG